MADPRPASGARRRYGHLPLQVVLAIALGGVLLLWGGAVSSWAADATIQAGSSTWNPSTATVSPNGTVEYNNSSGNQHALTWESGPETPSCPGIPTTVGTATSSWNGTCTFAQSGEYKFFCPVHPGTMQGTITVSGTTEPVVSTEPATTIKDTEATLNGKVNPSGQATTYWFEYGTTTSYDHETTHTSAGGGTTTVSKAATVMGLSASTTYHFRMVAENTTGKTNGSDRSFVTAGPPTATTGAASGIGSIQATLKGTVNPKGLPTKYFFNYGETAAYGQKTTETEAGSGTSNVPASKLVTGLSPETTYHFQLVAKNDAGETKGSDQMFTTTAGPVATTGQATGVGETSATLEGVVNPQGQETKYFFEYGTTTGYGQKTAEKSAGTGTTDVNVSEPLAGLAPGTTYHFRVVADGGDTAFGLDQTFTTASTPPPPPPPPPPLALQPPPPLTAPDTKITGKPPAKTKDRTPTVKFAATIGGASFQCSVDNKPFKACRSPFTAPSLKPGRHRIRVKAVANGLSDTTPASCSFKVLAKKKRR